MHLILARARNGVIGDHGALPWRLPEDLAHFKRTTMGHAIVMGRKTWDSLGRPLPGRLNLVLTRDTRWRANGAVAVHSLPEALRKAQAQTSPKAGAPAAPAFVIGGAQLYELAMRGEVAAIHMTEIDADFPGDTVFAELDKARWRETSRERFPPAGDRRFAFDFVRYEPLAAPAPVSSQ